MLRKEDFKKGKIVYYSDFYDKFYSKIKLIKITKTRKNIFWFNAEIIDNDHCQDKKWNKIGSIHSYNNSFIYNSLQELKDSIPGQKQDQINWLFAGGYKLFFGGGNK
jgi:hypothetical protein